MSGSQIFRTGARGARLRSTSPVKCSASNRWIHASTGGRETYKKRLMLTFSQP
jgi:hypothetical protein